jgi:hypothetical protein
MTPEVEAKIELQVARLQLLAALTAKAHWDSRRDARQRLIDQAIDRTARLAARYGIPPPTLPLPRPPRPR